MYVFVCFWKVFSKLGNGGVKYDELYAWLISLLEAGSEFDKARRQENKPITPMVSDKLSILVHTSYTNTAVILGE